MWMPTLWFCAKTCPNVGSTCLGSLVTGLFSRFAQNSRKREPNAAGPIVMIHEVATLVHLMKSSKPEPRTEGIRLIVLLGVP